MTIQKILLKKYQGEAYVIACNDKVIEQAGSGHPLKGCQKAQPIISKSHYIKALMSMLSSNTGRLTLI